MSHCDCSDTGISSIPSTFVTKYEKKNTRGKCHEGSIKSTGSQNQPKLLVLLREKALKEHKSRMKEYLEYSNPKVSGDIEARREKEDDDDVFFFQKEEASGIKIYYFVKKIMFCCKFGQASKMLVGMSTHEKLKGQQRKAQTAAEELVKELLDALVDQRSITSGCLSDKTPWMNACFTQNRQSS